MTTSPTRKKKVSKKKATKKKVVSVPSSKKKATKKKVTKSKSRGRTSGPRTDEEFKEDLATRKEFNIKKRKESLRNKLKGLEYLRQLDIVDAKLDTLLKEYDKKTTLKSGEELAVRSKVAILREKSNLNLRRLNKVVGDIRSSELSEDGEDQVNNLADVFSKAVRNASRMRRR